MIDLLEYQEVSTHLEFISSDESLLSEHKSFGWRLNLRPPAWKPPTDVYETEEAIVVRVEIAGIREEDFQIELDGRFLSIRGIRSDLSERRAFHLMEIRYGEFLIGIELPSLVVASEIQANYQAGLLKVILPKSRTVQIRIKE